MFFEEVEIDVSLRIACCGQDPFTDHDGLIVENGILDYPRKWLFDYHHELIISG